MDSSVPATLPAWIILDPMLTRWLQEDIGRGDLTTQALGLSEQGQAKLLFKQAGCVAGLPLVQRVFSLLDGHIKLMPLVAEGEWCAAGTVVAELQGPMAPLLTGERVALNLIMRLSGIATLTKQYGDAIATLPTQLVDTRKTTPGLRLLEKYATRIGGAKNHRLGLDDAVMLKDNHIQAAGGIGAAIDQVRTQIPYPLAVEVETETLEQVTEALEHDVDIIMLDNMLPAQMQKAVGMIRACSTTIKIEASGNITLDTIRAAAETGVDYISTSAPITQAPWLDISLRMIA
ncbi:putative nicotinate-nucleotide pyrophosphorylase[carboxylating] [Acaryochloris thomasi RCC1774]|uniref:Probable nicotinate-nucleotide pyrophosphorylase [carboxylating] n=1 Tax=Acaryochloris thomasi RCC1774 TaxID=1764569 RepID=A0A2W1JDF2_9CYAN|nr:carboxylating nicotinate-nucleotide diphosphorylase [Acaryochloris thomasi]PZD71788.1 putative nicotinate-nucleotide pyrophosphorylase[carboxylating] [Acaryochloris thomasi RCC1774]